MHMYRNESVSPKDVLISDMFLYPASTVLLFIFRWNEMPMMELQFGYSTLLTAKIFETKACGINNHSTF